MTARQARLGTPISESPPHQAIAHNRTAMSDLQTAWDSVLPEMRKLVTGRNIWVALNSSRPIVLEDGVLIVGVPIGDAKLGSYLRQPQTQRAIMDQMSEALGKRVEVRIIDGDQMEDWEMVKQSDVEKRRLQDAAHQRAKTEQKVRSSWESVFEGLARIYASYENRSLPQIRAEILVQCVDLVASAIDKGAPTDDQGARNFARCIERVATYTEVPSALIAMLILQQKGALTPAPPNLE